MALNGIPISENQCMGDSLTIINDAFVSLDSRSVTGTSPITVTGTTTKNVSIAAATTSAAGSMSSTDKTRLDDASSVNGLVKCNGSGNFSAAVAGTDYLSTTSNQVAKAWVLFNGSTTTPTVLASYNVTSVSRNTTGNFPHAAGAYQINFATNTFSNTNYIGVAMSRDAISTSDNGFAVMINAGTDYKSTAQYKIDTTQGGNSWSDSSEVCCVFFA